MSICKSCGSKTTKSRNGTEFCAATCWVDKAISAAQIEMGDHPDLFSKKDTKVVIEDWKQATVDDLRKAAEAGVLDSDEIDEIEAWQEQAEADGDLSALTAEGLTTQLAEAVASGLADELRDLDETGRRKRIQPFIDYWKGAAASSLEYETEGDGFENSVVDFFQESIESNVSRYASAARTILSEMGHPRVDDVTDDTLETIVSDPDLYDFVIKKDSYARGPSGSVWSTDFHHIEEQHDGIKYDEYLKKVLKGLSEEDLVEAAKQLENDSPHLTFGRSASEGYKKYLTSGSFWYYIHEIEDWSAHAVINSAKLEEKVNEALQTQKPEDATPAEPEVIYRYAGTNDTIAGASGKGMFVVKLRPSELGAEGAALGICVGRKDMPYCRLLKAGEVNIYSIRTEAGKPKFTIEEKTDGPRIVQVKGKANRLPGFASGGSEFSKLDEVRLVVEFLLSRGYTKDQIRNIRDVSPGILGAESLGEDVFAPPVFKKKPKDPQVTAAGPLVVPHYVLRLAARASAQPWGHGVRAATGGSLKQLIIDELFDEEFQNQYERYFEDDFDGHEEDFSHLNGRRASYDEINRLMNWDTVTQWENEAREKLSQWVPKLRAKYLKEMAEEKGEALTEEDTEDLPDTDMVVEDVLNDFAYYLYMGNIGHGVSLQDKMNGDYYGLDTYDLDNSVDLRTASHNVENAIYSAVSTLWDELTADKEDDTPVARGPDHDTIVYRFAGTNDTIAGASGKDMYVAELGATGTLRDESKELGHCIGNKQHGHPQLHADGITRVFSIRAPSGKSKFTIEYFVKDGEHPQQGDLTAGTVSEVKGKSNRLPGFNAGASEFSKQDEVRLVVDFLMNYLKLTPEQIEQTADIRAGVAAMKALGLDPFAPPKVRQRLQKDEGQMRQAMLMAQADFAPYARRVVDFDVTVDSIKKP